MAEPEMNMFQRALQFWSVLVLAAREQKIVTYGMMSQMTGMANEAAVALGPIVYYCRENKLPLLNTLVVEKKTGEPGYDWRKDIHDLSAEQRQVFLYDWLGHGAPHVEDFEEARKKHKAQKSVAGAP
jgi:hypothetical protein